MNHFFIEEALEFIVVFLAIGLFDIFVVLNILDWVVETIRKRR